MSEQANIALVQQLYADFGTGKIAAMLERIHPEVRWFNPGPEVVPYARQRQGLQEAKGFFETVYSTVEVGAFEPKEFFASGDRVIALGAWSGRARSTGKSFTSDWAMAFTFSNGRVLTFRAYEDTHAVALAFSG